MDIGVIIIIIIIIIFAYIFFQEINTLKYRLNKLEKNLQELTLNLKTKEITEKPTPEQTPTSTIPTLISSPPPPPPPPPIIPAPEEFPEYRHIGSFIDWLKENWIMKAGAFLLILAFLWFITYAFKNNLIGPQGRIAIGFISGLLFLFIGSKVIKKYSMQGTVLTILGLAIIIITSYAGQILYEFFNSIASLSFIFLTSVYVTATSYIYNSPFLAALSLIISSIAPLILNYSTYNIYFIFSYLTIITIGYLWLSVTTQNKFLGIINILIIFLYSFINIDGMFSSYLPAIQLQGILKFAYLLVFIFFIANTIEIIRASIKDYSNNELRNIFISAILNSLLLIYWINKVTAEQWQVFVLVIWSILFIIAAYYLFQATKQKLGVYIYSLMSLITINNAFYILLTDVSLLITLVIEVVGLCFASYAALKNTKLTTFLSYMLFILLMFSLPYFITGRWYKVYTYAYHDIYDLPKRQFTSWDERIFHDSFFLITVLMLGFTLVALFFKKINIGQKISTIHSLVALVIFLYLIWSISHALLITTNLESVRNTYDINNYPGYFLGTVVSLTIYVLIGLGLYIYGLRFDHSIIKKTGAALILLVIARILIVETWALEIERRIIIFFIVGLILLLSAIFEIKKHRYESSSKQS
ncbi:MAG: hypothetical protein KatS3mg097_467 [Candidatus Parcubacteria bacterium]|nr:MAG: hypothetical protein KatS3mg097_467 [Candidatus Parcubacteria bacterium]